MIPNTTPYLIFIRASVFGLRSVVPASITYCVLRIFNFVPALPRPVEWIAYAEIAFYFFVSLPRQWSLDKSKPRPVSRSRSERHALFEKAWSSTPDPEKFLSNYFRGFNVESIHRDDLKDWLAWAFLYKTKASLADDEELESYVRAIESGMGRRFPDGSGKIRPAQVSTDPLRVQHKPLLFYVLGIGGDDLMTYFTCWYIGFRHYRLPLSRFWTVFPFRPQTLLTPYVSASKELSYWYRPHTSKTRSPVLFIHGIGAGMRTYTGFLNDFMKQDAANGEDGQVGIIALELMPISMRITKEMPPRAEMLTQILAILERHGWDKFVIMAHSYGTIIATHLLQELGDTGRIGPVLLVDPVTIALHWGDVPHNFIYRRPRKASEWQLHYFASTDMCSAHSVTRRFDWTVNDLWKDDMKGRAMTIALAEEDIIMDTRAMAKFLLDDESLETRLVNSREFCQRDADDPGHEIGGIDIIWYDVLNHAGVFDCKKDWSPLVDVLERYCARDIRQ